MKQMLVGLGVTTHTVFISRLQTAVSAMSNAQYLVYTHDIPMIYPTMKLVYANLYWPDNLDDVV